MTFDLTPEQDDRAAAVRAFAASSVAPAAASIDRSGRIPDNLAGALEAMGVWSHTPLDAVLAIEELGAISRRSRRAPCWVREATATSPACAASAP